MNDASVPNINILYIRYWDASPLSKNHKNYIWPKNLKNIFKQESKAVLLP